MQSFKTKFIAFTQEIVSFADSVVFDDHDWRSRLSMQSIHDKWWSSHLILGAVGGARCEWVTFISGGGGGFLGGGNFFFP